MILVRSERRLPPTKGISVGWEVASEARRVIQVRVVLGYVSVEPWDPTRDRGALRLKQHSQKVRTEPLRPWKDAPAA